MSTFETKAYGGVKIVATDGYVQGIGKFMTLDIRSLDPSGKSAMSNIPLDQAHALADWIKANIPNPPKPTFKEQFDALAVGDWFTHGSGTHKYIKLNHNEYVAAASAGAATAAIYGVWILGADRITITRIDPKEANQ